jgi:hypothetical protein
MSSTRQERLRALLRVVHATAPEELDCDQFLARVAPLLEAVAADAALAEELRPVAQHLTVCPECKEEFDALLRAHGVPS